MQGRRTPLKFNFTSRTRSPYQQTPFPKLGYGIKSIAMHCDPEPDFEKLKCLHHFYTVIYDSNAKNCHYY